VGTEWGALQTEPEDFVGDSEQSGANETGISACVPTPKLWPIISHLLNRRLPKK
jgi:hypothetical protein